MDPADFPAAIIVAQIHINPVKFQGYRTFWATERLNLPQVIVPLIDFQQDATATQKLIGVVLILGPEYFPDHGQGLDCILGFFCLRAHFFAI
jgi:hypothetical protein